MHLTFALQIRKIEENGLPQVFNPRNDRQNQMSFREPQARGNPSLWIREISVQHRHGDGDFQALCAVFGGNGAVMAVDDLFDDGKADARAIFTLMLRPVEPTE